jgi:hypothetical protein
MQGASLSFRHRNLGITFTSVDIHSLFKQVTQYGLTNVTTQAQSDPVNPDQYIFWDYLLPTTKMHQLIAGLVRSDITRVLDLPSAQTKLPVSDDFTSTVLNTDLWTVEAPPDATVTVASGHSILSLPGGVITMRLSAATIPYAYSNLFRTPTSMSLSNSTRYSVPHIRGRVSWCSKMLGPNCALMSDLMVQSYSFLVPV